MKTDPDQIIIQRFENSIKNFERELESDRASEWKKEQQMMQL